jgi:hypothetical protein
MGPLGFARYAFVLIMISLTVPSLMGQVFEASDYNSGTSNTYGIQEAIDAASAAGGGTVEIGPGAFTLNPRNGTAAILIRPHVRLVGSGVDKTILKLTNGSKQPVSLIANANYRNPDAAAPDRDMTLEAFTLDANAEGQVVGKTVLQSNISGLGLEEALVKSPTAVKYLSVLCVDPGPNQEIVTAAQITQGGFKGYFFRPHSAGAQVLVLVYRLYAIALIGAQDVTVRGMRIRNVPLDGVYISNTVSLGTTANYYWYHQYETYSQRIVVQNTEFLRCYRNGVSVVNGSDIHIVGNTFRFITGAPGAAVDVEPDRVEAHASNIEIRDNVIEDCYFGIMLALHNNGPTSENSWGQEVVGNVIRRVKVGCGILLSENRAAPTVTSNEIHEAAWGGIVIVGTTGARVVQNVVYALRNCRTGIWVVDGSMPSVDNYIACNKVFLLDPISGSSSPCGSDPLCGF